MLYKKYHRNFVKQFKFRAVFGTTGIYRYIVETEPYYDGILKAIRMISGKGYWNLVYQGGQINENLHVVQEIS